MAATRSAPSAVELFAQLAEAQRAKQQAFATAAAEGMVAGPSQGGGG